MKRQLLLWATLIIFLIHLTPVVSAQDQPDTPETPRQGQIVGGQAATPGEFPWQVMLLKGPGKQFWCGGSLIAQRWVLTAAHCLGDIRNVVLGAHRYGGTTNEAERQVIAVKREIAHPAYGADRNISGDIALLELATPATLNNRVQLVQLVTPGQDDSLWSGGKAATITGWGDTAETGGEPAVLQKVTVPLVDRATCNQAYGGRIRPDEACAGLPQGGKDSCYGDSGGPLIVPDGSGRWKQAAIVSWGKACALAGFPGVYAAVAYHRQWIQENMGDQPPTPTPGTPVPTPTPIVTPTPAPNGVQNGDFEARDNGAWRQSSSNHYALIDNTAPVAPHSGQYLAWLGGTQKEKSRLSQTVMVPSSSTPVLTYYYQIADALCGKDQAKVFINSTRVKAHPLCVDGNTNGWQQVAIDLSAYAGQTVKLQFFAATTGDNHGSFLVDDVAITTASSKDATVVQAAEGVEDAEATPVAGEEDSGPLQSRRLNAIFLPLARR